MKKILYTILVAVGSLFFSCENDYKLYDATQINKIYFAKDTVEFSYGARTDVKEDVSVLVKLIGLADLSQAAEFLVVPDESRSTAKYGQHYEFSETPRFYKDSIDAYVKLDFKRDALIKDVEYTIHLNLVSNDKYAPTNVTKCVVKFGDVYIPQPTWWMPDRLGSYTPEKYILFVNLFHESKSEYPEIYQQIEDWWGKYLYETDYWRHKWLLTTNVYLGYLKKMIYVPMYDYYLSTGDEKYRIQNPWDATHY